MKLCTVNETKNYISYVIIKNNSVLYRKTTFLKVAKIELIHLSIKRNSKSQTWASIVAIKPTNKFIRNVLCMEVTNI